MGGSGNMKAADCKFTELCWIRTDRFLGNLYWDPGATVEAGGTKAATWLKLTTNLPSMEKRRYLMGEEAALIILCWGRRQH